MCMFERRVDASLGVVDGGAHTRMNGQSANTGTRTQPNLERPEVCPLEPLSGLVGGN